MKHFSQWSVELACPFLQEWEGVRLTAYQDSGGVWTIGSGHIRGVRPRQTISQEEAQKLLIADLNEIKNQIQNLVKPKVTQSQFIALLSFAFNIGSNGFKRSKVLEFLNVGKICDCVLAFMNWRSDNGVVIKGLVARRIAEADLFINGGRYR